MRYSEGRSKPDVATYRELLAEVRAERERADSVWGGDRVDDRENGPEEWGVYVARYATRWMPGRFPPFMHHEIAAFRRDMIKVANLAIEAVEQTYRRFGCLEGEQVSVWNSVASAAEIPGLQIDSVDVWHEGPIMWSQRVAVAANRWIGLNVGEEDRQFQAHYRHSMLLAAKLALDAAHQVDVQLGNIAKFQNAERAADGDPVPAPENDESNLDDETAYTVGVGAPLLPDGVTVSTTASETGAPDAIESVKEIARRYRYGES